MANYLTHEEHCQWMREMSEMSARMALKQKLPNDARYYAVQAAHQAFLADPKLREVENGI